jgi:excisionase family DNA binding protein
LFYLYSIFASTFIWVGVQAPRGWEKANKGVDLHTPPESHNSQKAKTMAEDLRQVADLITANIIGTQKEVLTTDEASKYLGVSKATLYKMTMERQIPHYKSPTGRLCYFNRKEIEAWMQNNRVEAK